MFNCQGCGKTSEPGQQPTRIPITMRTHEHPERDRAYPGKIGPQAIDWGGMGTQIMLEMSVGDCCAVRVKTLMLEGSNKLAQLRVNVRHGLFHFDPPAATLTPEGSTADHTGM